jgi:hypothetical protein
VIDTAQLHRIVVAQLGHVGRLLPFNIDGFWSKMVDNDYIEWAKAQGHKEPKDLALQRHWRKNHANYCGAEVEDEEKKENSD